MKEKFCSYLHNLQAVDTGKTARLYDLIKRTTSDLKTYNQIMNFMEVKENQEKLGIVLVCSKDLKHCFVFQHLPLFCYKFGIKLITMPKGSRKIIEDIFNRKFIFLLGIKKEDVVYNEIKDLIFHKG